MGDPRDINWDLPYHSRYDLLTVKSKILKLHNSFEKEQKSKQCFEIVKHQAYTEDFCPF